MHATVSHTLGPSAVFAAPSVTRFNSSDVSTSYAVMRTAPGGNDLADRDRTVWKWRDRHSRRPEEQPEPKQSAVVRIIFELLEALNLAIEVSLPRGGIMGSINSAIPCDRHFSIRGRDAS